MKLIEAKWRKKKENMKLIGVILKIVKILQEKKNRASIENQNNMMKPIEILV